MGFVRCMGYSEADIEPSKTVTSNGIVLPSEGYIGMKQVEVNVDQSLESLTVTSNGIYTPSSGNIGFSSVAVDVPTSSGTSIRKLTIADNANSVVSANITIPNTENLLIESYYNIIGNNLYNWNYCMLGINVVNEDRGIILYNDSFSVRNHIGYSTGTGTAGYIPPISVTANDNISIQLQMNTRNTQNFVNIVFLIYY